MSHLVHVAHAPSRSYIAVADMEHMSALAEHVVAAAAAAGVDVAEAAAASAPGPGKHGWQSIAGMLVLTEGECFQRNHYLQVVALQSWVADTWACAAAR